MTFTSIPRLQALEYMMRQIPRYRPDPSDLGTPEFYVGAYGDYIRKFHYRKGVSGESGMAEENNALPWNTNIILMASPFRNPLFERRIQNDMLKESEEKEMIYKSHIHRRVFKQAVRERKTNDRIFLAVLFILTANHTFWNRIKHQVTIDAIHFERFPVHNCTTEEYTIFRCAQDLYTGTRHITVADLADAEIVSKELFRVICNAMTIARYGLPIAEQGPKKGESTK